MTEHASADVRAHATARTARTARRDLPIAIVGAGPVGLAAAAHLVARGERPLILEAGAVAGASLLEWAHVRMFSPWAFNVDPASVRLLEDGRGAAWPRPSDSDYPTGADLVERYVAPLAQHPAIAPHLQVDARVVSVSRLSLDRTKTAGREHALFVLRVVDRRGREREYHAKAVIDASGTYRTPNPLGANGYPALGERGLADRVFYGIPDVLDRHRDRYANRRVLILGSGHSAMNVLLDLAQLAHTAPATRIVWAVRRASVADAFGGGDRDQLPERGRLGARLHQLVETRQLAIVEGFALAALDRTDAGIVASNGNGTPTHALAPVDEIVAATGFRPDLEMLRELRLDLDAIVESPRALAPLIDPNIHSCGTVPPHGAEQLQHPERDFFVVGMKSYGRAPTFLLRTGYEQVRSVVAALTGDWASARRVELVLPETGVCSTAGVDDGGLAGGACCGPAATTATVAIPVPVPLTLSRNRSEGA